jgi:hypothetical protein
LIQARREATPRAFAHKQFLNEVWHDSGGSGRT